MKELESLFKNDKTKVYISKPFLLENGNIFGKLGNKSIILDKRDYNILYEVKKEKSYIIKSVTILENKDLIFLTDDINYYTNNNSYKILIYRLKDNKYTFAQIIKEEVQYKTQYTLRNMTAIVNKYIVNEIKNISRNRFIIISNYGFKIFSLNEKEEYSLILIEELQGIQHFYQIDEMNFIFCLKDHQFLYEKKYDVHLLDIFEIKLEKITEEQKLNHFTFLGPEDNDEISNKIKNKIISSLQYTSNFKNMYYEYCKFDTYSFDAILIDNNRYYIINKENQLYIFNTNFDLLKRYIFFNQEHHPLTFKIMKYDDNSLIINKNGKLTLIEIEKNSSEKEDGNKPFNLKIIAYCYFPGIEEIEKRNKGKSFYQIKRIEKKEFITFY